MCELWLASKILPDCRIQRIHGWLSSWAKIFIGERVDDGAPKHRLVPKASNSFYQFSCRLQIPTEEHQFWPARRAADAPSAQPAAGFQTAKQRAAQLRSNAETLARTCADYFGRSSPRPSGHHLRPMMSRRPVYEHNVLRSAASSTTSGGLRPQHAAPATQPGFGPWQQCKAPAHNKLQPSKVALRHIMLQS